MAFADLQSFSLPMLISPFPLLTRFPPAFACALANLFPSAEERLIFHLEIRLAYGLHKVDGVPYRVFHIVRFDVVSRPFGVARDEPGRGARLLAPHSSSRLNHPHAFEFICGSKRLQVR